MVDLSRLRGVIATCRNDLHRLRLSRYYLSSLWISEVINFLLSSATGLVDLFILFLLSFERSVNFIGSIPERTTATAHDGAPEGDVCDDTKHYSLLALFVIFITALRLFTIMVFMTLF